MPPDSNYKLIIANFILFQTAWFVTLFSAVAGTLWYGPLFTLAWIAIHLRLFTDTPVQEGRLLIIAAIFGYVFDSLLVWIGVFSFPAHTMIGAPSTIWMIALWVNLAATLNVGLRWLHGRMMTAAVLGAIAGPATYYAGSKMGAIVLIQSWSLLAISIEWLISMPLLLWLATSYPQKSASSLPVMPAGTD